MARGLDHLVLATRDLDQCAAFFRRLGFTVGARNRHPWGTLNHIVQLDGTFLELIGTEPNFQRPSDDEPVYPFAGFLDRFLGLRDGFAMVVLESRDAQADAAEFAHAGIGLGCPFYFERKGRRPDGSVIHVAFTLSFAATPAITDAGFFVCQQHFPEAFWSPALQQHANGALRVTGITLIADEPLAHAAFLEAFTGERSERAGGRVTIETGRGVIEAVTPAVAAWTWDSDALPADAPKGPHLAGIRLAVKRLALARAALQEGGIPFSDEGGRLVVPASAAFGTALAFEVS